VEIRGGFATAHILGHHFLLHADQETWCAVLSRTRPVIAVGVLSTLPEYWMALSWRHEDAEILDTAEVAVADVARLIAAKVAA
jgi:hypothetical protein